MDSTSHNSTESAKSKPPSKATAQLKGQQHETNAEKPVPRPRKSSSNDSHIQPTALKRPVSSDSGVTKLSDDLEDLDFSDPDDTAVPPQPLPPRRPRRPQHIPSEEEKLQLRIVEDYRQYAVRKQFTEEEFNVAIQGFDKPLHEVDTNELLAQLLSVRAGQMTQLPQLPPRIRKNVPNTFSQSDNATNGSSAMTSDVGDAELRSIVLDGSNIAMSHGRGQTFSWKGISLAAQWFKSRGHTKIKAFVPQSKLELLTTDQDRSIISQLREEDMLVVTPVRRINETQRVICYDDRFILQCAVEMNSIVVSNDQYRDLVNESAEFRNVITKRILVYTFVDDSFMPAADPLGKRGPTLDQFLLVESSSHNKSDSVRCPYGRKCTYGIKCKYSHPEKGLHTAIASSDSSRLLTATNHQFYSMGDVRSHAQPNSMPSSSAHRPCTNHSSLPNSFAPQPTRQEFANHPSHVSVPSTLVSARGLARDASPAPCDRNASPSATAMADSQMHAPRIPPKPVDPQRGRYIPLANQNHQMVPPQQLHSSVYRLPPQPPPQQQYAYPQRHPMAMYPQEHSHGTDDFRHQRLIIYGNLSNLFPVEAVDLAMRQNPLVTDPAIICQAVMAITSSNTHQ